ncbi:OmpP1/FadL family transporter [Flavobacterium terrigena]|uniref:Outer membrane protein transport protein (OMPP1/FadL/TodX) n=1 Tax=Flavobacterium terrigena TaxID=402734 RepID=A0A1H6RXK0_9FLAO|nr:outer membrane protein transport protein [Flavobacterium terrigena]SEI56265.1 Outer membrane protein transport protein (OMPP1/FadL/TodX) [Flavobacterium terrigena]
MKKILLSLLIGGSFMANAQEPAISDALRYGVQNLNGTARFRAMGGAFGAIGGDMSAININPAGSSIFNFNQAAISLSSINRSNNASYFGTSSTTKENTLDINQLGAVFVFNDKASKSGWKKFALGLNYENANNLDDYIVSEGVNPYNSMDNYFLNRAQGFELQYLQTQPGESIGSLYQYLGENQNLGFDAQQAFLGYQSYVLSPLDESDEHNTDYFTNVPTGGNYYHKNTIQAKGYNGKFTANFSGAYQDKLYVGMNMNFHFTDYVRTSSLYESNLNDFYDDGYSIDAVRFNNELYTYGSGFSLNLGAIYKATENVRVGLAYETPTWYRLNDELTQSISSNFYDATTDSMNQSYVNPGIVNVYPTYKIQTPSKLTGSATVLFGKKGLLSVDYSTKNYAKTEFKPNNETIYSRLNTQMKDQLQDSYELRVGGEYKIQKWSVRGGYRFEQSPYKTDYAFGDLMSYSGGLGYNFGKSKIDISYTNEHRARTEALLTSGLNDTARIKNYNNNVTLSYVINF